MLKALITGITGQDGSYLTELLLKKGYEVHGIIRRTSTKNTQRIDHLYRDPHTKSKNLFLHYGDLADGVGLQKIIEKIEPDEIYNLGAQSHVRVSFDQAIYTADIVATGCLRMLEAYRNYCQISGKKARFYQACSSEMYGSSPPPQNENTPFQPRNPYAVAKLAGYWYARIYRENYNLFVVNGILFNHESPRRGENFITRKITLGLSRIKMGLQKKLFLGNLEANRDWGFAGDYVEGMCLLLQNEVPDDFVLATGEEHSVREFLDLAAESLNLDWHKYVKIDPHYFRPLEAEHMIGDYSKAKTILGWSPKIDFKQLVKLMVGHDLELATEERKALDDKSNKSIIKPSKRRK